MIYLFYTVHIIVSVFLILVVLLQQGKGADLSVFGGGSTQTAFGARSATTLLHKLTVTSFVLFICTTLMIGILQGGAGRSSLMRGVMADRLQETARGATAAESEQAEPAATEDSLEQSPPGEDGGEP